MCVVDCTNVRAFSFVVYCLLIGFVVFVLAIVCLLFVGRCSCCVVGCLLCFV